MTAKIEMVGRKINFMTVLSESKTRLNEQVSWVCLCVCGKTVIVRGGTLRSGRAKSCGCKSKTLLREARTKHGHKAAATNTYSTWMSMLARCRYKKHKSFQYYGGRGISVCQRWLTFCNFLSDMGAKPEGKTLGRIDNDGSYCPENCRWESVDQQMRNRSNNRIIEFNGKSQTLAEWSRETGFRQDTIACRLRAGWSMDDALTRKLISGRESETEKRLREEIESREKVEAENKLLRELLKGSA